jgi:hypothetical protein
VNARSPIATSLIATFLISTVLALTALAGCATPEGNAAAYRDEALSTLKAAHSAVESVHITVSARLQDKVFGRSADDAVSLASESLSGAAGTFVRSPDPFDVAQQPGAAFSEHLLDVRTQLERTVGQLEIVEGPADVAGPHAEQRVRLVVGRGQNAVTVDHDMRHGTAQQGLFPQPRRLGVAP